MSFSQALFSFQGRLARLPFFGYFLLGNLLIGMVMVGGAVLAFSGQNALVFVGAVILLAAVVGYVWVNIAINIKRLHDLGMSGTHLIWIMGINFAAGALSQANASLSIIFYIASACIGLWMLFAPGQQGSNKYGPQPGNAVPQGPYAAAATHAH